MFWKIKNEILNIDKNIRICIYEEDFAILFQGENYNIYFIKDGGTFVLPEDSKGHILTETEYNILKDYVKNIAGDRMI